jgi:hypothetical protein
MKLVKIASDSFKASLKNLMKMHKVPAQAMFKIRGIAKIANDEAAKHDELKNAIAEEFGERDASGNLVTIGGKSVRIQKDKIKEMEAKIKELADIEVPLPEIKFSDLGQEPTLTAEDLYELEFIVE